MLRGGPITESLEELALCHLDLPPSELPHLYGLRRLRTLDLADCFSSRLDDATVDILSPPTSVLPGLTAFVHSWQTAGGDSDNLELRDLSYEWMQARLTQ